MSGAADYISARDKSPAAKASGLVITPSLLARADDVLE
jgi:hypothetical protein